MTQLLKKFQITVCILLTWTLAFPLLAQKASDPPFKVKLDFNRWHDVNELYGDMHRLQLSFPKFITIAVIGKSVAGRDLIAVTINNPDTGVESSKAGMYIEANVHGNEIQGSEICLYTVWYLMENYGRIPQITKLVNERVFYILPTVNPDGRQYFLEGPSPNARSGHYPYDEDNDYLCDEDQPADLNGNNLIEQMRKYVPGKGTHRISKVDARLLEPVLPGEKGDYILLGMEGIDRDGDGLVSEDDLGGYDPNRNFPSDWQPEYVQRGALDFPLQLPEARAVTNFMLAHPNIAGVQSYHNAGGMILRGPGAEAVGEYPPADVRSYDELGKNGERILPYYRYMVIWSGLYTVHGGFIDWASDGLGILSFTNELWNTEQYFNSPELKEQQKDPSSPIAPAKSRLFFNDKLEFGAQYMDWKPFKHPQFGDIEIGGVWRKTQGRIPPRFMNEELCHRNMAFTLYQADELPALAISDESVKHMGGSIYKVLVDISNSKWTPTILERAAQNNTVTPDILTFAGKGLEVISASWVDNHQIYKVKGDITELSAIEQKNLHRIIVRNGIPGKTTRTIMALVKGSGDCTIAYHSVKGGQVEKTVHLK